MKHIGIAFLTYAALVLQTGWRGDLAVRGVEPVFLPLMLVVVIFAFDGWAAILWAAIIGLVSDCVATGDSLGIDMLSSVLIAFVAGRALAGRVKHPTAAEPPAALFFLMAFFLIDVFLLFSTGARILQEGRTADPLPLLTVTAAIALYTATIGLGILLSGRTVARLLPQRATARG